MEDLLGVVAQGERREKDEGERREEEGERRGREEGEREKEGGRGGEEGGRGGEEGGEGERREGEGERREEEGERAPSLSGSRFSPVDPGKRTRQRPRASEFSRERLKARSLPPAVQGEQQFTLKSRVSASVISGESAVSGGLVLSPGTGPAVDLEIPFLETEGHEGWPEAKS